MTGNLLLLSTSKIFGGRYLDFAFDAVTELLLGRRRLVFVPYAVRDHAKYTATVRAAFEPAGIELTGLDEVAAPADAVRQAEAVFIGGGNSFRLLRALQDRDLIDVIRQQVLAGAPYMGSSAGSNMACPSLRTTNDMPIVQPASFAALNLIPFQLNPHYQDPEPGSRHMGETREDRITEFLEENDVPVLGLREGSWLRVAADTAAIGGVVGARLFSRGGPATELVPGDDVSTLLTTPARFDAGP
ncbi:MAG TPA: dipeptidase PepE [Streptosporangiaceae bacterium]|jgi:dipeptidase E|nr:dipeptidase PepE [Streptosporangiaceae bacterium]